MAQFSETWEERILSRKSIASFELNHYLTLVFDRHRYLVYFLSKPIISHIGLVPVLRNA